MQEHLQEAIALIDRMSSVVGEVRTIHRQLDASAKQLDASSEQTTRIADTIADVASRTQMLPVNATIQAAHAGAEGRGFAVVAEEVGRLAGRSNEAVDQVRGVVGASRHDVAATVKLIEAVAAAAETLAGLQSGLEAALGRLQHAASNAPPASAAPAPPGPAGDRSLLVFDPGRMATGEPTINDQHRKLIDVINQLDQACAEGRGKAEIEKILDFLAAYVVDHFSHEECIFEQKRCPNAGSNRAAHQQLIARYHAWRKGYDEAGATLEMVGELVSFLKTWLTEHICHTDRQLAAQRPAA